MRRLFVLLSLVSAVIGCGGGSKFTEQQLLGTWERDFRDEANEIMGPKMGPTFYSENLSKLRGTVEFKAGDAIILTEGVGPSSKRTDGTWKVSTPGKQPLKITVSMNGQSEDVVVKFIDADTIHVPGPPKIFGGSPIKRIQFRRVK